MNLYVWAPEGDHDDILPGWVQVVECPTCLALIRAEAAGKHAGWHRREEAKR
jgi:hypothetical protein